MQRAEKQRTDVTYDFYIYHVKSIYPERERERENWCHVISLFYKMSWESEHVYVRVWVCEREKESVTHTHTHTHTRTHTHTQSREKIGVTHDFHSSPFFVMLSLRFDRLSSQEILKKKIVIIKGRKNQSLFCRLQRLLQSILETEPNG